jgi:integrase
MITPGRRSLVIVGKGGKKREIPLNQVAKDLLAKYDDRINFSKNGKKRGPISTNRLWNGCVTLARQIGIDDFGPHSLRHYFATALILRGIDLSIVSKLLGHSSILTTERHYIHIIPTYLRDITEVLSRNINTYSADWQAKI